MRDGTGLPLGVVTRSFRTRSNEETARLLEQGGFTCTELCLSQTDSAYWVYNGRSDMASFDDSRAREVLQCYQSRGIEVVAVGVFTNLLEPNDREREANLAYFERHMQIASLGGVRYVSTECGFIPGRRGVQAESYESAFSRLRESLQELMVRSRGHGVAVALEPCVLDVVPSAKRMRDLLEQIGAPELRVLLDPANLIANSSEEDMFSYLGPHVAYFHAKDRRVNDTYGRIVGEGDIDWRLWLSLYHKRTEGIPILLDYVTEENYLLVRDRLLEFDRASRR